MQPSLVPATFSPWTAKPRTLWLVRETAPEYGAPGAELGEGTDEVVSSLGDEIMTLAEHLHAETHRWLMLIAEFDRLLGWKLYGFASTADWLAYSTRLDKITAREKVRVARALAGLTETSAAMSRGELSFSQVRALTRVADDENELELLEHARSSSAAGLERLVRSWKRLGREDEVALEARRHATRCLSVYPDEDGMYSVRAKLDPEAGARLMRAIDAASDALYLGSMPETTPEQRRADALALLVERAMAMGWVGAEERAATDADPKGSVELAPTAVWAAADGDSAESFSHPGASDPAATDASAETPACRGTIRPMGAWRSERYLVVLHVDEPTLTDGGEPGRSELEDGTRVSAETARRIACDASVVRVVHGRDGREIRLEGKTRKIPDRLRRTLEFRDRGCRFPGCGSRYTESHHIRHWIDGGPTRLNNLILLCDAHHRLLHDGGFRLRANQDRPDRPTFISSRGIPIPDVPPRMTVNGRAVGSEAGKSPTDPPQWERDVPLALYLRTLDSLG